MADERRIFALMELSPGDLFETVVAVQAGRGVIFKHGGYDPDKSDCVTAEDGNGDRIRLTSLTKVYKIETHRSNMVPTPPCVSLRDYFAGQTLPGSIGYLGTNEHSDNESEAKSVAARAYQIADAMIAEGSKTR